MAVVTKPTANVEAWHAVRELRAEGMTRGQIADALDLSVQMVGNWLRMDTPPARRPLGYTVGKTARVERSKCASCGTGPAWRRNARCKDCRRADEARRRQRRIDGLRKFATHAGRVPTMNEAADILGMSRSRAADLVKLAFGPAPANTKQRRPWPPS